MKRSFYWGITCDDLGHVHKLSEVEFGAMSPPLFRYVPKTCSCGSRYDVDHVCPYDAKTIKLASEEELRAAWAE